MHTTPCRSGVKAAFTAPCVVLRTAECIIAFRYACVYDYRAVSFSEMRPLHRVDVAKQCLFFEHHRLLSNRYIFLSFRFSFLLSLPSFLPSLFCPRFVSFFSFSSLPPFMIFCLFRRHQSFLYLLPLLYYPSPLPSHLVLVFFSGRGGCRGFCSGLAVLIGVYSLVIVTSSTRSVERQHGCGGYSNALLPRHRKKVSVLRLKAARRSEPEEEEGRWRRDGVYGGGGGRTDERRAVTRRRGELNRARRRRDARDKTRRSTRRRRRRRRRQTA